jgi:hypothetical protein
MELMLKAGSKGLKTVTYIGFAEKELSQLVVNSEKR